ncbi:hypothetical protein DH2020_026695 [Rehmannia glutinosa]|uniref:Uncharacterized protein n=1 Tax=Rehmannia glutinosa TaxID=99300 RepID=A0ABR0W0K1_REHGL
MDDVICHILSFLPTKLSAKTSILSRRWRFLWAHVPSLSFSNGSCLYWKSFSNIVPRVMFGHKVQSLNTFRLALIFFEIEHEIETWITTVISHNVKNLDIYLGYHRRWPKCIFTTKTLVDLRIEHVDIPVNGKAYLPRLKKLQLYDVRFNGDETLSHLLSGCPVLEELIVIGDPKPFSYNISSPTIKRLNVFLYQFYTRLEINAHALRYLKLHNCYFDDVSTQMLTSLTEADIRSHCALGFVDGLNNVKCLKLSCDKPLHNRALAYQSKPIGRFDNLTKLELVADWPILVKFLESADNLEVLIIREVDKKLENWMEPFQQVPKCLLSHLRSITIYEFGFAAHKFKMDLRHVSLPSIVIAIVWDGIVKGSRRFDVF